MNKKVVLILLSVHGQFEDAQAREVLQPVEKAADMIQVQWIQKIHFSARGNKSHLTIAIDNAMRFSVSSPNSLLN